MRVFLCNFHPTPISTLLILASSASYLQHNDDERIHGYFCHLQKASLHTYDYEYEQKDEQTDDILTIKLWKILVHCNNTFSQKKIFSFVLFQKNNNSKQ